MMSKPLRATLGAGALPLVVLCFAALSAGAAAPTAASRTAPPNHPMALPMSDAWAGAAHDWHAWLQGLKLSPEQEQSIKSIAGRYRPRWSELKARGSAIRDQLAGVSPQDSSYATVTQQASQDAAELAADLINTLSQMRVEIDAVLTAEQRKQLKDQWNQRRQRFEQWRSQHQPPAH